ncbi:DUF5131 family protein [Haloferula sp. A504]|uniref:DUF5131 family protein n=1 Tax=Haloferula sp. A504 TaxID=3373601 RepID=UPI0031CC1562|nr:phage Gp37/Gp68 family protein [Verrucomicrobiaceae bacterium E54]
MDDSEISWTHHTVNWWEGCTKVSEGCRVCYAEVFCERFDRANWSPIAPRRFVENAHENARKFDAAAREMGCKDVVFCSSLSDFFEEKEEVGPWRVEAWKTIRDTPNLIWIILTKRPENIAKMLPPDWGESGYENVCLAATVENSDKKVLERIEILRAVPARWRMLSVEPMIGPVDLRGNLDGIHMVVCGGESHREADPKETRPMHPDWARALRDACVEAEVPFFFKQWGSWAETPTPGVKNPTTTEWEGLTLYFAGTNKRDKAHPALLDGKRWHEHPFGDEVDLDRPSALARRREQKRPKKELTSEEKADFRKLDSKVRKGMRAFFEVGSALAEIRERKLWRAGDFNSWDEYCKQYEDLSKTHANRLIKATQIAGHLAEAVPVGAGEKVVLPTAESQVRPLARLKNRDQQSEVWAEAVKRDGGVPSAKTVEAVVIETIGEETDEEPKQPKDPSVGEQRLAAYRELREAVEKGLPKNKLVALLEKLERLLA